MILAAKVREASGYLRRRGVAGTTALLLEPEMKGFAGELSGLASVPMKDIPFFPPSLSALKNRKVLCGNLGGRTVIVLEGRAALYEGYFHREIAFPLRVLSAVGVRTLIVATFMYALGPDLRKGDLFLVRDHIDLTVGSTLRGFQPAAEAPSAVPGTFYSDGLRRQTAGVAARQQLELSEGVAALVNGPVGPTPAESGMLRSFGAAAVSMTLAAEAAAAYQIGLSLAAVGVLRDGGEGGPDPSSWGPAKLSFFRQLLEEVG